MLDVLYHHAKLGGARISSTLSFLSDRHAFLSITLLNLRGQFVVVHLCSTYSDCCQLSTSLNAEVQKMAKIGVFHRQRAIE